MARLSISELNNLSGVNDEGLDLLYNSYRKAHTKLSNRLNDWINQYTVEKSIYGVSDLSDNDTLNILYDKMKRLYYEGSILLNEIDIFDMYVSDYISLLTTLHKKQIISEVMKLSSYMQLMKKEVVKFLPECYEMYSYIYKINE